MASPEFTSAAEFRTVMDQIFTMMSTDDRMGPALRDADVPQRFSFEDVELVVNIRPARDGEDGNLVWVWSDDVDWDARVRMTMTSQVANKYFQGKENIAMAIARRRIKTGGDVKAALEIVPLTKPIFARYRELVEREYPHLAA
ncbi:MAG: SCP2 sterol-binding domain-containing protein [Solirubrobacterales bacterium]|nr:SCP2 sterol-binding domain-containing protein [Solirubrobacterales bacterium]